jgi:hypothetical protein
MLLNYHINVGNQSNISQNNTIYTLEESYNSVKLSLSHVINCFSSSIQGCCTFVSTFCELMVKYIVTQLGWVQIWSLLASLKLSVLEHVDVRAC